jgi:hypothetical protein
LLFSRNFELNFGRYIKWNVNGLPKTTACDLGHVDRCKAAPRTMLATGGAATSAERMRRLWERARRGLRRLTIDVSEGDLQAIAQGGYEGASADHD